MPIKVFARAAGAAEIVIYDAIGADLFGQGITGAKVKEQLEALGDVTDITLRINSPGGNVFDGLTIFNLLKEHPAQVAVYVDGLAASIASVIAMVGDLVVMGEGSMLMIHNPWSMAIGDSDDMRKASEMLEQVEGQLAGIYARRTGLPEDEIREMMAAETWLTDSQAVERGFADEREQPVADAIAAAAAFPLLSQFRNTPRIFAMSKPTPVPTNATEVLAREQARRSDIRTTFGRFADEHRALLDSCLDDPQCSIESARERLLAKLGEGSEPVGGYGGSFSQSDERAGDFRVAAVDALCLRAGIAIEKPHSAARDLRHSSVTELARACLSLAGRAHGQMSPSQLVKAALSTSDFPGLLENSIGKALRNGYELEPQSHRRWVKTSNVPDFKAQSRLLLGSAPGLEAVPEGDEYKYGAMSEDKATLQATKFGKALRLTWETLINDDLAAFMRIPQAMGAAARRLEADQVYALLTASSGVGVTMQDSVALFHADHGNLSTTVGAIATATLGAARSLLRKQTAVGNGGYLNLAPRFVLVAAEDETAAELVLAQATRHVTDTVATNGRRRDALTPEWISKLELVAEPRLNAAYGFYVVAGHDQIDTVELAVLDADGEHPVVEEEQEFGVDAKSYKVRHAFVAKAIDWRGMVRVPVS